MNCEEMKGMLGIQAIHYVLIFIQVNIEVTF